MECPINYVAMHIVASSFEGLKFEVFSCTVSAEVGLLTFLPVS